MFLCTYISNTTYLNILVLSIHVIGNSFTNQIYASNLYLTEGKLLFQYFNYFTLDSEIKIT